MFIEPFCGGAAVTLALVSNSRFAIVPYQGSKWRFRKRLIEIMQPDISDGVWLNDLGPWGDVWPVLHSSMDAVIARLEVMAECDPRELYDLLRQTEVPRNPVSYAAAFLFLQRLQAYGSAVSDSGGAWVLTMCFDRYAYGYPATARFGAQRPQVPAMVERLRATRWEWPDSVRLTRADGLRLPMVWPAGRTTIYADPPYTTGAKYGNQVARAELLATVRKWQRSGADVWLSEAEPLSSEAYEVGQRQKTKRAEWLSHFPPVKAEEE